MHQTHNNATCHGGYCATTDWVDQSAGNSSESSLAFPRGEPWAGYTKPKANEATPSTPSAWPGFSMADSSTVATRKAGSDRVYMPSADVIDSDNETLVILDMPGVSCDDVELTLEKNILTIEAVPADQSFAGKSLVYSEYGVGDFRRSFSLSEDINRDDISASMKNGVLTVKLSKIAPVTKKINVGSH